MEVPEQDLRGKPVGQSRDGGGQKSQGRSREQEEGPGVQLLAGGREVGKEMGLSSGPAPPGLDLGALSLKQ